jgi:hypothetical protein
MPNLGVLALIARGGGGGLHGDDHICTYVCTHVRVCVFGGGVWEGAKNMDAFRYLVAV